MADVFLPEKRSEIMRKVKSKRNQSTEMRLIAFFKANRKKVGDATTLLPGNRISFFPNSKPPFSPMAVFGMVTIAGIPARSKTKSIGQKRGSGMLGETMK